jgi:hypothetical protein
MASHTREGKGLRAAEDLRAHWHDFCDCDYFDGIDTFPERMEAAGLIHARTVTKRDIQDDAFAAERGIEIDGLLWELTEAGAAALR